MNGTISLKEKQAGKMPLMNDNRLLSSQLSIERGEDP